MYAYVHDTSMWVDIWGLEVVKIDGYKITIHLSDKDPFPSIPHGHIYDRGLVIDNQGTLFKALDLRKGAVGKLSKKGEKEWVKFLKQFNNKRNEKNGYK